MFVRETPELKKKEVEAFCAGKMEENPVGWFINGL